MYDIKTTWGTKKISYTGSRRVENSWDGLDWVKEGLSEVMTLFGQVRVEVNFMIENGDNTSFLSVLSLFLFFWWWGIYTKISGFWRV